MTYHYEPGAVAGGVKEEKDEDDEAGDDAGDGPHGRARTDAAGKARMAASQKEQKEQGEQKGQKEVHKPQAHSHSAQLTPNSHKPIHKLQVKTPEKTLDEREAALDRLPSNIRKIIDEHRKKKSSEEPKE
jgi:hypothetical protein